jgi:NAD(P)-dependent dehydrogenase (short-subunit alcohol dehydrogenase family)
VILNIGSTAGVRPRPGLTWYNASKGAVNLVSKSMALELAPDRIRVNCVAPVMGATGMLEAFMGLPDTAGEPGEVRGDDPDGAAVGAGRHRRSLRLSRLGRGGFRHGSGAAGRRGADV